METAVDTLRQAIAQIEEIEDTTPIYDLQEFASECDDLVAESERLLVLQARHRRTMSDLHEESHLVRAEAALLRNTLNEMRGEFDLASSLPHQIECPTCGHEYQNSLAERFALIEDEGVLSKALTEAKAKLGRLTEKELAERGKLDEISASLTRAQKILETEKKSLSLNDVLVAAGKTESYYKRLLSLFINARNWNAIALFRSQYLLEEWVEDVLDPIKFVFTKNLALRFAISGDGDPFEFKP